MGESLVSFWKRADIQDPAFREEDLHVWPAKVRETLKSARILHRIQDAGAVDCDSCGEPHFAEVVRDPKHLEAPYYLCPTVGRVRLKPDDLQRWGIAFDRLAAFLSDSLTLSGRMAEVVVGRVWLLGRLDSTADVTEVFLFRGIWWPDAAGVLNACLRLRQCSRAIVLLVRRFPPEDVWENRQAVLLALSELTDLDQSGFQVLRDRIVAAVPTSGPKVPAALKVARSIGSEAAVQALLALKGKKGWTMEELAREIGTTARTLQGFKKRHSVRSSVFRTMANRLGITPEDLLGGNVPGAK